MRRCRAAPLPDPAASELAATAGGGSGLAVSTQGPLTAGQCLRPGASHCGLQACGTHCDWQAATVDGGTVPTFYPSPPEYTEPRTRSAASAIQVPAPGARPVCASALQLQSRPPGDGPKLRACPHGKPSPATRRRPSPRTAAPRRPPRDCPAGGPLSLRGPGLLVRSSLRSLQVPVSEHGPGPS